MQRLLAAGVAPTVRGVPAFMFIALAPRSRRRRRKKSDLQPARNGV